MSLRWRRRTRGRKHQGAAVIGALREETQVILAWRRKLPPRHRAKAITVVADLMAAAVQHRCQMEARFDDAYHRFRMDVTWSYDDERSENNYLRVYCHTYYDDRWDLALDIPVSAVHFVLATLREEESKP